MATTNIMAEQGSLSLPGEKSSAATGDLLVSLAPQEGDGAQLMLEKLAQAFPDRQVIVATTDEVQSSSAASNVRFERLHQVQTAGAGWTPTAADFLNDSELLRRFPAQAVLRLGQGADFLRPDALQAMTASVLTQAADLTVARYTLPAGAGLVNSAMIYPLVRALFATEVRFPLALDMCCSARAWERLGAAAQKTAATGQQNAIAWPVIECAVAGFQVHEVPAGARTLPQPDSLDLNAVLAQVAGSLFAEVDLRAAFWQRSRVAAATPPAEPAPASTVSDEQIANLQNSFRLAYSNLHEVWSLVLPPQSLLGLKRLSTMSADAFAMSDALWARIVYDFLLAYRLRTINRGHLLGALTPLYLAWVASHLLLTRRGTDAERHVETVANAFETEKPYLVSRWRWPDRFNP